MGVPAKPLPRRGFKATTQSRPHCSYNLCLAFIRRCSIGSRVTITVTNQTNTFRDFHDFHRKSCIYFRKQKIGHCGRYEPRFKPPRERLPSGKTLIQNHLPLGGYDTFEDAKSVHQIAAFYYGKAGPHLDLGDGRPFTIDSSWNEQLDLRRGKEKAKWVASKAKELFQDFKKAKASLGPLNASSNLTSVIPSGEQIANARDSSHSGFSSPAINKSTENLASSSRATLLVASNPDETEAVLDEGDGAANKELSGDVEYIPVVSPLPVTQDSFEPTYSSPGLPENLEGFVAYLGNLTDEQLFENNGSTFNANGHPQGSAVNVKAKDQRVSLFVPCPPVVEVTAVEDNEGSYVEVPIPDEVSLDITTVPIEGALPTSQGLQSVQDGVDVGAPLSDPSFGSELSIEDHLFKLLSFYRQECGDLKRENSKLKREHYETRKIFELEREKDKRRISELERDVKRLKGKSPDEI